MLDNTALKDLLERAAAPPGDRDRPDKRALPRHAAGCRCVAPAAESPGRGALAVGSNRRLHAMSSAGPQPDVCLRPVEAIPLGRRPSCRALTVLQPTAERW